MVEQDKEDTPHPRMEYKKTTLYSRSLNKGKYIELRLALRKEIGKKRISYEPNLEKSPLKWKSPRTSKKEKPFETQRQKAIGTPDHYPLPHLALESKRGPANEGMSRKLVIAFVVATSRELVYHAIVLVDAGRCREGETS